MKLALGAVVLAALAGLPAWILYQGRDTGELSDEDLRVRVVALSESDNAYTYLERAAAELTWPDGAMPGAELLDQNRYALEHLVGALSAGRMQLPRLPAPDADPSEVESWVRIGELLAARARLRADYGRQRLAVADSLATLRLGRLIEGARGGMLLHASAGLRIVAAGLDVLDEIAARGRLDSGRARRLIRELAPLQSDSAAGARMWAAEYQWSKATAVHDFATGFGQLGSRAAPFNFFGRLAIRMIPDSYAFHPRSTFGELAESFRALQAEASRVCFDLRAAGALAEHYASGGWRGVFEPNGAGRLYMARVLPDYRGFQRERCLADTRVSLLRTRLALHAYRSDKGALPRELAELVPRYVARLPRDAFDGNPLQYSSARRELWSPADEALFVRF